MTAPGFPPPDPNDRQVWQSERPGRVPVWQALLFWQGVTQFSFNSEAEALAAWGDSWQGYW